MGYRLWPARVQYQLELPPGTMLKILHHDERNMNPNSNAMCLAEYLECYTKAEDVNYDGMFGEVVMFYLDKRDDNWWRRRQVIKVIKRWANHVPTKGTAGKDFK